MMTKSRIIALAFFILLSFQARSQNTGKIGADFSAGYVCPSHKFLQGRNETGKPINKTVAGHIKYGIQLGPQTELGRKYPNTYQGIGLSYHHFFNDKELGSPFCAFIFQHTRIASLAPALSLDGEWNGGIAWNWVKYDPVTNPNNRLMGASLTAYINVGLMLNWNFSPLWNLTAGADFTHVSNGNTAYPNYGLNTVTFRTGIMRSLKPAPPMPAKYPDKFQRHVTYDLTFFGSWRKKVVRIGILDHQVEKNFGVAGINFNPMYNICKYFRTGLSLDMLYDSSSNVRALTDKITPEEAPEYSKPAFEEQIMAGLSARAELVLPIFSINIGVGMNLLASGEDKWLPYEILALKAHVSKNLYLHAGCTFYNLQFSRCMMFGLGYRFNSRY